MGKTVVGEMCRREGYDGQYPSIGYYHEDEYPKECVEMAYVRDCAPRGQL